VSDCEEARGKHAAGGELPARFLNLGRILLSETFLVLHYFLHSKTSLGDLGGFSCIAGVLIKVSALLSADRNSFE
jgi:hypothetical protein